MVVQHIFAVEVLCQSSKPNSVCVPDGGALLHQVPCEKRDEI